MLVQRTVPINDPFSALRLFDDIWATGNEYPSLKPALDVVESDIEYTVTVETPGLAKDEISIEFKDNHLTISGEKQRVETGHTDRLHRVERSYGSFSRSIRFAHVDPDSISAAYDNGVLTVTLPKSPSATARRIELT